MAIKQIELGKVRVGKHFTFINGKVHPIYGKRLYTVQAQDIDENRTYYLAYGCEDKGWEPNSLISEAVVEIMVRDEELAPEEEPQKPAPRPKDEQEFETKPVQKAKARVTGKAKAPAEAFPF